METKTVAGWLASFLEAEGVQAIFGVIGGALLEIVDSLRRSGIRYIPTQHELSAAYMADVYARETGRPGVCMFTVGPGATNAATGVAQAYVESSPVIVIAGEVESLIFRKGASVWHEIDQTRFFEPITKEAIRIERPDRILEGLERAFRVATTGRQGPVYVGIPADFQKVEVALELQKPARYRAAGQSVSDSAAVKRAADLLTRAQRPFILAGGGVQWSRAAGRVLELAELLGAPVANTPLHKGLIPESRPLAVGGLGDGGRPSTLTLLHESDLLLALGCTFSQATTTVHFPEHMSKFGNEVIPRNLPIVQVDIDPEEIGKNYPVELGIVGDAGTVVTELLELLENQKAGRGEVAGERRKQVATLKAQWDSEFDELTRLDAGPITRAKLFRAVAEVFPADTLVMTDEGHVDFPLYYPAQRPAYFSGDWRTIGCGLPMAIGMKLIFPDKPVVAICGDGAFSISLQELITLRNQGATPVILVLNNAGYSGLRARLNQYYGASLGTDFTLPDLTRLAHAFDLHAERVEDCAELKPALERCMRSGKGAIVDIPID